MAGVLFLAHNRRGLGHVMRGMNIATALRSMCPDQPIDFFARSSSATTICGERFGCLVDQSDDWRTGWAAAMRRLAPNVVVYDTLMPDTQPPAAPATVYVMRRCKPDRQAAIFASPFLDTVDRIVIPHDADEFGYQVPAHLAERSCFVGPIVRPLDSHIQAVLRNQYALRPSQLLVVSTPGGGGFVDDAASFFAVVTEVHRQLLALQPSLLHVVVRGPNYPGELPALPGMKIVTHEPQLGNLFGLADLVIAEGGYNTVQELRLARTPAVFLPGDRSYDDQEERVRLLEAQGAALVFTSRLADELAPLIARLATNPARLQHMRNAYGPPLTTGNQAAAAIIAELLEAA